MTNLPDHDSISALAARPPENLKAREISHLQAGLLASVAVLSECDVYDTAAGLMGRDPHTAHDLLLKMDEFGTAEFGYPMIRVQLMASAVVRMKEVEAGWDTHTFDTVQNRAGGLNDQAREAAFRANPGRFLLGARTSSIRLLKDDGFGLVSHAGREWAWTYAAAGMARSDLSDLVAFVDDMRLLPLAGGILVGPPEAHLEVVLPEGWLFVAIELGNTGRAAR